MKKIYSDSDFFDKDESIYTDFSMQPRELHMHSHEFFEFSYVYEGEGLHHTEDGTAIPVKVGDLILVSPGISHCITSPDNQNGGWVRVIHLLLKKQKMQEILKQISAMHEFDEYHLRKQLLSGEPLFLHIQTDSQSFYSLLMVIAHENNHFCSGSRHIIETSVLNFLLLLLRQCEQSFTVDKVSTTRNETIDILIKYIRSNYSRPLSLELLAAYVHLSPEYLSRYFKKNTGTNLSVYLSELRIEHAKYLLRTTNFSISDISMHCGFQSISNFQKVFKRFFGMNAGQYRQTAKKESVVPIPLY